MLFLRFGQSKVVAVTHNTSGLCNSLSTVCVCSCFIESSLIERFIPVYFNGFYLVQKGILNLELFDTLFNPWHSAFAL